MFSGSVLYFLILLSVRLGGCAVPVGREARDLRVLTKTHTKETKTSLKEHVNELTVTGDSSEVEAFSRYLKTAVQNHLKMGGITYQRPTRNVRYSVVQKSRNWIGAVIYCKEKRMNLATVRSEDEHERFVGALRTAGIDNWSLWIGGTKLESDRGYFWITDSESFTYTKWHEGQPDDEGGIQKCLTYMKRYGLWRWDDDKCYTEWHFVCEYQV